MSINLRFPNITGIREADQINQIKSYLHQLVQELNWALSNPEATQTTGTPQGTISEETISEMQALVLQASNALNQYYDKVNGVLEANYLKKEAFNAYKVEVTQLIEGLAEVYLSKDDLDAYKLEVEKALEDLAEVYVTKTDLETYQEQVSKEFGKIPEDYVSKVTYLAKVQEMEQNIETLRQMIEAITGGE